MIASIASLARCSPGGLIVLAAALLAAMLAIGMDPWILFELA